MAEDPLELIRRYYEFYNERRFQEGAELFAPDAVIEHAPFGKLLPRGGAGYIDSAERSVRAFPDAWIEVLGVEKHGETTYDVDLVASGTHQGVLDLGVYGRFEATGVRVKVRHREVLEIRNGKITYASVTLDVHDLITQLTGSG
jgi:ketosteroid isomerase-like protein